MVWKPDAPAHIKVLYIWLNVVRKQSRSSSHSQTSQLNAAEPLFSSQWLLGLPGLSWGWNGIDCLVSREGFTMLLWTSRALCINSLYCHSLSFPLKGCLGSSTESLYFIPLLHLALNLILCICGAVDIIRDLSPNCTLWAVLASDSRGQVCSLSKSCL